MTSNNSSGGFSGKKSV